MRLDHLLSKEASRGCITVYLSEGDMLFDSRIFMRDRVLPKKSEKRGFRMDRAAGSKEVNVSNLSGGEYAKRIAIRKHAMTYFRWRCAWGEHTYPSRTRNSHLCEFVKPQAADGTMLETAWESRWLPEHI